jgi:hypothetical protein
MSTSTNFRSLGAAMLAQRLQQEATQPASAHTVRAHLAPATNATLPEYVSFTLARYRLLHDIPFHYLVPDAGLLPVESVRFFRIDPDWIDALVEGALCAGGRGSRELQRVKVAAPQAHASSKELLGHVRSVMLGRVVLGGFESKLTPVPSGVLTETEEPPVTGMLLRSKLVSGWPGMKLRAWTSGAAADVPDGADPTEIEAARPELVVPILRLERLSPDVMLAVFDGMPRMLWLEEPHHEIQLGIEQDNNGYSIGLRDEQARNLNQKVAVPMRSGAAPGVLDIAALAHAIDVARPLPQARGSAALALQLLQAPSRQRFGA